MTASVRVDLPAGLAVVVLIDGAPARPGAAVAVAPGVTEVDVLLALDVAGGRLHGTVRLPVAVPPDARVRVTPPLAELCASVHDRVSARNW